MEHTRLPLPCVSHLNTLLKGVKLADLPAVSFTAEWPMRACNVATTDNSSALLLLKTVISHGVAARWNQAGYGEK